MSQATLLIALAILSRFLPLPPNAVPLGAIALFAGARLPVRWAFIVPLLAMIGSDLVIDWNNPARGPFDLTRWSIYGAYMLTVAIGLVARRNAHPASWFGLSLLASSLFFLTSNLAVWYAGWFGYPMTTAGLLACYDAAIPFFRNTVVADLIGVGVLFGLDAALRYARSSQPVVAPRTGE